MKTSAAAKERKVAKPAKKSRIPNAERSAVTRQKLVEATVMCLYEYGYHQTSTVVVTTRARVSRGAMLHHFPTKADLMLAAMEYIRAHRGDAHRAHLERFKTERDKFLQLIDVLWAEYQTPTGVARIELMLGSRNDPELRPRFSELSAQLERSHKERVWMRASKLGIKNRKKLDAFVQLYAAALRGLAIDVLWQDQLTDVKGAVALLKELQLSLLDV